MMVDTVYFDIYVVEDLWQPVAAVVLFLIARVIWMMIKPT